ncbi:PPPDE peptidase domain-containing protein 2 [Mycena venus]|uniref:PPPDE peptidase domain-containing protein 2 n=1 Tax=Mycena venus TaxID=2733690 RepID=A0A8H6YKS9_9AGAR|nr:PPPDE peptidase domain-containing protein 2 [Mycena venus]
MASPVKLYIYDLSKGKAKQLDVQLTGRQISGIWHTSIVVFDKEVFYDQGIHTTLPGLSHRGQPVQIEDLGETEIDQETWEEYLEEMRDHYTADKYHPSDFNSNSFTNDCVGFLTGGTIPAFVKDLPTATESLTASVHSSTNSASFTTLLRTYRAVVACFADPQWSPPCRVIVPMFEKLAEEKGVCAATGGRGAAFTKIDLRVGEGSALATEWSIHATPTFMFFLDGTKISELKGHIHYTLIPRFPLPAVKALSLAPILFTQVPSLEIVFAKLASLIDAAPPSPTITEAKEVLHAQVAPYLKARFAPADPAKSSPQPSAAAALLAPWAAATTVLVEVLPVDTLFPLVDIWRLAVLDPGTATWLASSPGVAPLGIIVRIARNALAEPTQDKGTRNYVLTALRLLTNTLSHAALARVLLAGTSGDGGVLDILLPALLHADPVVRTAAASLAFNASACVQRVRVVAIAGLGGANVETADSDEAAAAADEEWQVQLASALVEALDHESREDVVHRLVAALACLLHFAPAEGQVGGLFKVLGARGIVMGKLEGASLKKEVRSLVEEAGVLCPSA